ncbi:MAG: tRNA epoxyqueuosine(34) reductase QueG [Bacteroidales bacterium]
MSNYIKILSDLSNHLGFIDFGIAKIEKIDCEYSHFEEYLQKGYHAGMKYMEKNLEKRYNPALLVDGAKSVICFLAPYGTKGNKIASFALGMDYHIVIKKKLNVILDKLNEISNDSEIKNFNGRVFVDSAPIMERTWAVRAELGFIGKNNFLISPQYGLRTFIGEIICNIPYDLFESKRAPIITDCEGCNQCIEACPSGALCAPYTLNAKKCISYHTIESTELYDIHPVNYNEQIFGCEKCLEVCPWNKKIPGWPEFETNADYLLSLTPENWIRMNESDFKTRLNDSPLKRAGLKKIKNNL